MKDSIGRIFSEKINNERNRAFIKKHYGVLFLIATEAVLAFFLIFFGDKMYVAINDNLDSNVVLMKIFRDNNCWIDRTTPLPFLGGLSRDLLTCGYTLQYINYWIFDTQFAYWFNFLEAIAISAMGFYYLGVSYQKLSKKNISPNMFCVCGVLYSLVGFWPHSIIAFSLIPWWAFLTLEYYRTKKWWIILFFIPLQYNISGPLIGVFLLFYTFAFYILVSVKERKFLKEMTAFIGAVMLVFAFFNRSMILQSFSSSKDTIKGLASREGIVYNLSIRSCLHQFRCMFLLEHSELYHSGVVSFRYTALPLMIVFFILFNIERKRIKVSKDFLLRYNLIFAAYAFNSLLTGFDKCAVFRKAVPFFSGFSFSRFMWLSPFILVLALLMIIYFLRRKGFRKTSVILVLFVLTGIVNISRSDGFGSWYNSVSANYTMNVRHEHLYENARWEDYYRTELFDKVKKDIGYNGEWVVAYGFDTAILQYNSFKTLDGYYSNYPLEYKLKWEQLIAPTLRESLNAREYWKESNGQRAIVYTAPGGDDKERLMLINPEILEELGGKYVISRYKIVNYEELHFEYINTWTDKTTGTEISVYSVGNHE